jgi:sortase A
MLRTLQHCLWVIGFIVLGYCGMAWTTARLHQSAGNDELDRLLTNKPPGVEGNLRYRTAPPHGELVGRVSIPRLGISTVIFEGTDEPVLNQGVGHLTGSALPGLAGNVVLAGHRDSFFRPLRNIRAGDMVEVTTAGGSRSYLVQTTEIITPDKVSVLEPTKAPTLTLVTCYPFYYVGHAPKRFIVRGSEIRDPEIRASKIQPRTTLPAKMKSRRGRIRAD